MKEISEATVEKISQTKLENGRKQILEGFVKNDIPQQINNNLAIPSHRTRKWISFDQFKTFIEQGKSLQGLCKAYSKHLMAFYSYLSKGKITLTKEQFEEAYNKGIPLDEIGRSHNIPREHITHLREYYGIKRKGATYQRRLQNEIPLSQEAKDVVIGSLLGDGHITPTGYFSEKHSEKQVEYLEWKASFFKSLFGTNSMSCGKVKDKRSNAVIYSFCVRTCTHDFLIDMREKFYNDKEKIIPIDLIDMMNEKILAIWFLDDGHTDWFHRTRIKYPHRKPCIQCKISTESFGYNGNVILKDILMKKWGLKAKIFPKGSNFFLRFNVESSRQLVKIITPYVFTKDMFYKISYNSFLDRMNSTRSNQELILRNFVEKHGITKKL